MTASSPARQFARSVVEQLRSAGFEAYWAGGCVRDQLRGWEPVDYDVATNATPDQIRTLFGPRRTFAVGAAFGVVTVRGPRDAGHVEVATFRRDLAYSDGRHPDGVEFTSAEEDARRRDFTINGLFLDPLTNRVFDFVGGQEDLQLGVVRAIGDATARFAEDKLRMLRAVRFAATFNFQLDPLTRDAIRRHAGQIVVVSVERIAAEMRRILMHSSRSRAVQILDDTGLLDVLLPEIAVLRQRVPVSDSSSPWERTLKILETLDQPRFPTACAGLFWETSRDLAHPTTPGSTALNVAQRWKLSNADSEDIAWLLDHESCLRVARTVAWPRLQRVLIDRRIDELMRLAQAVSHVLGAGADDVDFCRDRLTLAPAELNPPPLLTGDDLRALGLPPGPHYRALLEQIRDAQLEQRIRTKDEALAWAMEQGDRG